MSFSLLFTKRRPNMETIGEQKLWTFVGTEMRTRPLRCTKIRHNAAPEVTSFMELARRVAELQFMNRDHVLLFREQAADYLTTQNNSSLKPTLFRPDRGRKAPDAATLYPRFTHLSTAEELLLDRYRGKSIEMDRLKRHRILRWAILQHYEICPTPLLDVTHSLRIAASFASQAGGESAFVFVLGVPNLSGAITASAEAGLQIVRLSSVCPPAAVRPHIQEGYLLGEYPEIAASQQKAHYPHFEIDFGRRLVAKFRFNPHEFWKDDAFPMVERDALYPNNDPLCDLAQDIRQVLNDNA